MTTALFSYIFFEGENWPPHARPHSPFGPSVVEIIRSCPLRSCFGASPGYERRMDYPARVGTAFHKTLQSFYDKGLPDDQGTAVKVARERFEQELHRQEIDALARPREKSLPKDTTRVDRAIEAILLEATRYVKLGFTPTSLIHPGPNEPVKNPAYEKPRIDSDSVHVEVEVPVRSQNGLFQGRIDQVEHTRDGTVIYDFKSALRDDLPGRYQRQVQLYSLMWQETHGDWPIAGYVVYPLAGKTYPVSVDPQICRTIGEESADIIRHLQCETSPYKLALPGDICTVCEYRPWCSPFWSWQAEEKSHVRAIERASLGFPGTITRLDLNNHRWHLTISWRDAIIRLSTPEERLPHLHKAKIGQTVLVLDAKLQGAPYTPLAIFSEYSELFLLQSL
jgi:CRISPR/Cas system-associated exonuclease Cas4 (RecB family)